MKEAYSDFSIIKSYLELRQKYDSEIKAFKDSGRDAEEKTRQHIAMLEQEVARRNDYIKSQDRKLQELSQKNAEQEEQLRQLGLQLHKIKMQAVQQATAATAQPEETEQGGRRRGFFK